LALVPAFLGTKKKSLQNSKLPGLTKGTWERIAHALAAGSQPEKIKPKGEPQKNTSYFPLNPGWLIGVPIIKVYQYIPQYWVVHNPQYNPLTTLNNQGCFIAQVKKIPSSR